VVSKQFNKLAFENVYAGSAKNVINNVLLGKAEAGVTFTAELDMEPMNVRSQLRTLFQTPKISSHPFCAHPRVSLNVQAAVKKAVIAVASSADGAALLEKLNLSSPVAADYEKDYNILEDVDVKRLSNWGE